MEKKNQEIKKEALEIIELAIDDLTTLARAFDLVGELAIRGCPFIENHESCADEPLLH